MLEEGSAEDVSASFRAMLQSLECPNCKTNFTEWSCDWADAWHEGRRDLMRENGEQERDGPCKIKCELCGERSWVNYFSETVKLVSEGSG